MNTPRSKNTGQRDVALWKSTYKDMNIPHSKNTGERDVALWMSTYKHMNIPRSKKHSMFIYTGVYATTIMKCNFQIDKSECQIVNKD